MNTSNKPTIPEIIPLLREFLQDKKNIVGGVLHVVLDDDNIGDSSIRGCIEDAIREGDKLAQQIGEMLLKMSKTQRTKITGKVYSQIWREIYYY